MSTYTSPDVRTKKAFTVSRGDTVYHMGQWMWVVKRHGQFHTRYQGIGLEMGGRVWLFHPDYQLQVRQ